MDTQTGEIATMEYKNNRTLFGGRPIDPAERRPDGHSRYVPVGGPPDPSCSKCRGTGSRPRGTKKRRFYIACSCTVR